jgi:hypothetical protein
MAGSRPYQKRPPSLLGNRDRLQSKTPASRAVRGNLAFPGGSPQRDHEPPLVIESDLSGEMAVGDQELDAIVRLLGGALDDILSGTGGE